MTQVYHIAPSTVRWAWLALPMILVLLVTVGAGFLVVRSMTGARSSTFEVSSDGLRLKGDVYGRFIPKDKLVPHEAERVTIATGGYRPTLRVGGTALPGYRSGWFRLANGSKGLLYVTDPTKVVKVPTTEGYTVLLSVNEADAFVNDLRKLAP
jgi:hypothetical protein